MTNPNNYPQVRQVAGGENAGAEMTIRALRETDHGGYAALIGPTIWAIRYVMVEGPSGILSQSPREFEPQWLPRGGHGGELHWPPSPGCPSGPSRLGGPLAYCFTAGRIEQLRGYQFGWLWAHELSLTGDSDAISIIEFAHRLGPIQNRRGVMTSAINASEAGQ
jgi:phage terminase large subunit-like protein